MGVTRRLALVRCVEDERRSALFPHAFPALLRETTRTGEELEARIEVNRGGPRNPLSKRGWRRRSIALPDAQSVEDLTALLTSAGER